MVLVNVVRGLKRKKKKKKKSEKKEIDVWDWFELE